MVEARAKTPPKAPAIIAACVLCLPLTASFEGLRTHPYADPARPSLQTVCYGETEQEMRVYTPQECKSLLQERQARDYAPAILKCASGLASRPKPFAASIDFAYNAGIAAFCRSPMARKFNAGDWHGGCNAFSGWYVTAGGKRLAGLVKRREAEKALCMRGAA